MENNIDKIIADNIVMLRKRNKWTQAELAEKLNYTDKAISKWERAESTPEAKVLYQIASIFDVPVDFFFHEHELEDIKNDQKYKRTIFYTTFQLLLIASVIWLIAAVIFTYATLNPNYANGVWIVFVYAGLVSAMAVAFVFKRLKNSLGLFIALSCILWVALTCAYLQLLILNRNYWLIFIIGVPAQVAIVVGYLLKREKLK